MVDNIIKGLSQNIAKTILSGFDRHFSIFSKITKGAQQRFEDADWQAERDASRQRIRFYDLRVKDAIDDLRALFDLDDFDGALWLDVKQKYVRLIQNHDQPELAETFYNSVFCALFHRDYFDNSYIFIRSAVSTEFIDSEKPAYHVYYPATSGLRSSIRKILLDSGLTLPFENLQKDVRNITRAIIDKTFTQPRRAPLNFQFQVISTLFYRNKAAYIIGNCHNSEKEFPFAIPILNNGNGAVYVDAMIIGSRGLSRLFEFSYAYFMVDHPVPSSIVSFLRHMMPSRGKDELYSAIGLHKQGKTDFYRNFLYHLKHSEDQFIFAPGIKGMVMAVFTLPSYPYVFKVIRDHFPPPKAVTRQQVRDTYRLVKEHDRVGRMSDTLEYSYVALPVNRFSPALIEELKETCELSVSEEGDYLILKHVYIERRMTPLNIAIKRADDKTLDKLMRSYGEAIKELAGANIFPGDLLMKNFGVTGQGQGRIVFYDYDEISYLSDCNFRAIHATEPSDDDFVAVPRYRVESNDVFPEELSTFIFPDHRVREAFLKYHADLMDAGFWQQKQKNIEQGIYGDVFPYSQRHRFPQKQQAAA